MPNSPNESTFPGNSRVPSPAITKSNRRLEYVSLALCGVLALAFAIVMPPLQFPHEDAHFIRAYANSRGEYIGRGIPKLPAPIISFVMHYPSDAENDYKYTAQEIVGDLAARTVTAPGNTVFSNENHHRWLTWGVIGSNLYCPLVYLPSSLGIWTARSLYASPLVMMYAARIFNVLTFVAALFVSFRLAPGYRALMTAVALMPMTLHQAGGISADLVTIAFSFVGFSVVLHAREHFVSRRFLILVALVFAMWGLCKSSVWALPLLWLIPTSAFKSRRAWLVYIGAASICMVGALLIWSGITSADAEAVRAIRLTRDIDISANVRLVAAHPLAFGWHLVSMVHSQYKFELGEFVGVFGWSMFSLPKWVRCLYLLLLVFVAAAESQAKPFLRWERGVLCLTFLAGAVFVHALMAVSDTTLCGGTLATWCVDSWKVVQGRYLIPFCLAGLLTLRQNRANLAQVTLLALVTGVGTLHALASLALIRSVYYL